MRLSSFSRGSLVEKIAAHGDPADADAESLLQHTGDEEPHDRFARSGGALDENGTQSRVGEQTNGLADDAPLIGARLHGRLCEQGVEIGCFLLLGFRAHDDTEGRGQMDGGG